MQDVLNFSFDSADMRSSLEDFDLLVRRCETAFSEVFADKLKVGLVHRGFRDNDLKQHLLMEAGGLTTYGKCRTARRLAASPSPAGP